MSRRKNCIRLITLILIVSLILCSLNVIAFASDQKVKVCGVLENYFKQMGYETQTKKSATLLNESFTLETSTGAASEINKETLPNGDISCIIKEGELTNNLTIKPDGTIYLNESLVTVSDEDTGFMEPLKVNAGVLNSQEIVPYGNDYDFVSKCPYGKASDYTNTSSHKKVISLGSTMFANLTEGVWVTLITTVVGLLSGVGGVVSSLGMGVALVYLKRNRPQDKASSIKWDRSVHKKGFTVSNSMAVAKYDTKYYANTDYTGLIKDSKNQKSVFTGYEVFRY